MTIGMGKTNEDLKKDESFLLEPQPQPICSQVELDQLAITYPKEPIELLQV